MALAPRVLRPPRAGQRRLGAQHAGGARARLHHLPELLVRHDARVLEAAPGRDRRALGYDGVRGDRVRPPRLPRQAHDVARGRQRHALLPALQGLRGARVHVRHRGHAHHGRHRRRRGDLHAALLHARGQCEHAHGGCAVRGLDAERPLHPAPQLLVRQGREAPHGHREPPHGHAVRRRAHHQELRLPVHQLVQLLLLHRLHPGAGAGQLRRGHHLHGRPRHQHGYHLRRGAHGGEPAGDRAALGAVAVEAQEEGRCPGGERPRCDAHGRVPEPPGAVRFPHRLHGRLPRARRAVRLRHALRGRLPRGALPGLRQQLRRVPLRRAEAAEGLPAPHAAPRRGHRHVADGLRGHHGPGRDHERRPDDLHLRRRVEHRVDRARAPLDLHPVPVLCARLHVRPGQGHPGRVDGRRDPAAPAAAHGGEAHPHGARRGRRARLALRQDVRHRRHDRRRRRQA
mmetsp:Transcript_35017/g.110127  ORF Transcript_35017/g.110127 Transcript_35017/m.110127 type:complete len:456 (-) Transcript_35017:1961-3328(-)